MVASTQCGRPATQSLALFGLYASTSDGRSAGQSRKIGSSARAAFGRLASITSIKTASTVLISVRERPCKAIPPPLHGGAASRTLSPPDTRLYPYHDLPTS